MTEQAEFLHLIQRVRDGEPAASAELMRDYEGLIRREVRMRIEDQRLRRTLESMDFVQSVMASFFLRASLGEYDLDDPGQLIRLLMKMTQNKVASAARKESTHKRDIRRNVADEDVAQSLPTNDHTPSQRLAIEELYTRAISLLTGEELRMTEMRIENSTWEEIADAIGGTAQARRVQHARAMSRVSQELELED